MTERRPHWTDDARRQVVAERVWAVALVLLLIAVLVVARHHGSWFWYGTANFFGGALFGGWMKNRGDGDE